MAIVGCLFRKNATEQGEFDQFGLLDDPPDRISGNLTGDRRKLFIQNGIGDKLSACSAAWLRGGRRIQEELMNRRFAMLWVASVLMVVFSVNLIGQEKRESKRAPAVFRVKFETTVGDFVIEAHRDWATIGTDRFYNLVTAGFYDDCKFFRAMDDFMIQFGINGDPKVNRRWMTQKMRDDPVMKSNKRGFVTFAKASLPNSRSTQIFINTKKTGNSDLDSQGFAPFGEVVEGMDVVDKINTEYGHAPQQIAMYAQLEGGNKAFETAFPKLDSIQRATIIDDKQPLAKVDAKAN